MFQELGLFPFSQKVLSIKKKKTCLSATRDPDNT